MSGAAELARVAGLLADETRAGFCLALLDGRAWTAGELAKAAGVARSTATEHLHKLVSGGLLTEERQGRHRYVRLADERAALVIEQLMAVADPPRPKATFKAVTANKAMAAGRTCYDHLAGALGVRVTDAMVGRGLLDARANLELTGPGEDWLRELGITEVRSRSRPTVRACLDWTERRSHVAGMVGAALCSTFFERGWVVRVGSSRAVRVTGSGDLALDRLLGLTHQGADAR